MEQNNSLIINFTKQELKDIESFCKLNELEKEKFIKGCFMQGYYIEKHGFLGKMGGVQEKWVEKEVIREKRVEIPIEIIKEVEKVVIKEIIKEVPVEKIVTIYDNSSENELLLKIQQLENGIAKKDSELDELRQKFSTKEDEITTKEREFSTITTENENIFQYKISKKDEELDELRQTLDELKSKPEVSVDNSKTKMLETTLQNLRKDLSLKNTKITELEGKIKQLESVNRNVEAIYLKGSNLKQNL